MNKKQTLITLILLSIGLNDQQKQDLIKRIGAFSDTQIEQMIFLFQQEQAIKDKLLRQKFQKTPDLAEKYAETMQHIASQTRGSVEQTDREANDATSIQKLLNELEEL